MTAIWNFLASYPKTSSLVIILVIFAIEIAVYCLVGHIKTWLADEASKNSS